MVIAHRRGISVSRTIIPVPACSSAISGFKRSDLVTCARRNGDDGRCSSSLARLMAESGVTQLARFSDGTAVTADIVARSLRSTKALVNKAIVDVHGDRVWFTLSAVNPRFDLTLTQSNCSIVLDRGTQLLGTGPFMFEHRPNLKLLQREPSIKLVRNPHHAQA